MAWVRRFAAFHDLRDPRTLTSADVSRFLTALAAHGVAASTQNQALSAVLFLYQMVLHLPVPELHDIVRARRPERLPVVLSRSEVSQVLARLTGMEWLMASMLYGCGLRLLACVQLRVKDVLLERGEVVVRHGKGGKDRVTMLPVALRAPLQRHLRERRATHEADLAAGRGTVALPDGLQRKFPSNDRSDSRQRGVPTRPW